MAAPPPLSSTPALDLLTSGVKPAQKPKPTPKAKPPYKNPQPSQRDMSHPSAAVTAPAKTQPPPKTVTPVAPHVAPIPQLQPLGVSMDINQINQHVDQIAAAHLAKWGYNPSPGLVYDLLKANGLLGGKVDYTTLFGVPTSQRDAQAALLARQGQMDTIATRPVIQPKTGDLIKALNKGIALDQKQAQKGGFVKSFVGTQVGSNPADTNALAVWKAYQPEFEAALADPKQHDQLVQALMRDAPYTPWAARLNPAYTAQKAGQDYARTKLSELHSESLGPPPGVIKYLTRAGAQIVNSTADMPFGFYQFGKAIGSDVWDLVAVNAQLSVHAHEKFTPFGHTLAVGKQVEKGIVRDVSDPTNNPGYLIMDIWGAASVGASIGGRAVEFARTGSAKSLVIRPPASHTEMAFGASQANLLLSDNYLVRLLQMHTPFIGRKARQANLDRLAAVTDGYADEDVPLVEKIGGGTMRSIARQKDRDRNIALAVAMTPLVELQRINRWSAAAKDVIRTMNLGHLSRKTRLGMEKAFQVIASDDPDPITTIRNYHDREIERIAGDRDAAVKAAQSDQIAALSEDLGIEEATAQVTPESVLADSRRLRAKVKDLDSQIEAHKAQIEALGLAEDIIRNPPPRLRKYVHAAYDAINQTEEIKKIHLGLDDAIAEQHVAEMGATYRGEHVIDLGEGRKGIVDEPVDDLLKKIKSAKDSHDRATKRLNEAKNAERIAPGSSLTELERATKLEERHGRRLANLNKKLEDVKASARPLERQVTPENEYGKASVTSHAGEEPVQTATETVVDPDVAALREGGPGSVYYPSQTEKHRPTRNPIKRLKARYGIGGQQQYLFHGWSGDSIRLGAARFDTSQLLHEDFEKAWHAADLHTRWQDLWDASVEGDVPPSSRHQPIRDIKDAPESLKDLVRKLELQKFDAGTMNALKGDALKELKEYLYGAKGSDSDHVRWVDENLMMDKVGGIPTEFWQTLDKVMSDVMTPINEPMRLALIFATPAYALNSLGSAALLMIQQGLAAPHNLGRAMGSVKFYGPEVTRLIDRLAGQTHASSLATETNLLTKGSRAFQEFWSKLTDIYFRRAAVINELKREGLLKEHLSKEELYKSLTDLTDRETQAKMIRAGQRGRKAMLDFNSMSWPERATLRHILFVYSFVRASGIWSLRYLRDHGAQADLFAQSGRDREQQINQFVGHMPDWFMKSGYFAVHPGVIYNPIQWNMPGMLEQIARPIASMFGSVPYTNAAELWGPAATFGSEIFTGVDPQGRALPGHGGNIAKSLLYQYNQTALGQIATKQQKAKKEAANPPPPPPVRSGFEDPVSAALAREKAGVHESVFQNDTWWSTYGLALFRSGIGRHVNRLAGESRYWRDLRTTNPTAYHKHELDMVAKMVARQGQVLGEPVPSDVIASVDSVASVSQAIEDFKDKHKGEATPNQKQINMITLDALIKHGSIPASDKEKWTAAIKQDIGPVQNNATHTDLLLAGGGKAWKDWSARVSKVDEYASLKLNAALASLHNGKLGDFPQAATAPRTTKWGYGRQSEAILQKAKEMKAAVVNGNEASAIKQQEWVQYVNENDKPITVNGVTFPSPFAYEYATKTPEQQQKALAVAAKRKPSTMTAFQQQLLTGNRPDPVATEAWQTLYGWLKEAKDKLPFGQKLQQGTKAHWEDYLAKKVPAFKQSLNADRAPLAKRMQTYLVVQHSPNSAAWNDLLSTAAKRYDQFAKSYVDDAGKPRQSLITAAWKEDVPKVQAYIEKKYPGFTSELALYTGGGKDAEARLTNFLNSLVAP